MWPHLRTDGHIPSNLPFRCLDCSEMWHWAWVKISKVASTCWGSLLAQAFWGKELLTSITKSTFEAQERKVIPKKANMHTTCAESHIESIVCATYNAYATNQRVAEISIVRGGKSKTTLHVRSKMAPDAARRCWACAVVLCKHEKNRSHPLETKPTPASTRCPPGGESC